MTLRRLSRTKKFAFGLLAAFLLLLLLEGCLSLFFLAADYPKWLAGQHVAIRVPGSEFLKFDERLGWYNRENVDLTVEGVRVRTDSHGFRGADDANRESTPGVSRIVCLGDSFTFGPGADDEDIWTTRLGRIPGLATINMGVQGYGIDQCHLLYEREGTRFDHHLTLLAIIGDDFRRILTDRGGAGFYKPRFELNDGALELTNVPVPAPVKTGDLVAPELRLKYFVDHLAILRAMRPLIPSRSVYIYAKDIPQQSTPLAQALFRDLRRMSAQNKAQFAIALLPVLDDYPGSPNTPVWDLQRRLLEDFCGEEGIPYLDISQLYANEPEAERRTRFPAISGHHPDPVAHAAIADALEKFITPLLPASPTP